MGPEKNIKLIKIVENIYAGYFVVMMIIFMFAPLFMAIGLSGYSVEQIDNMVIIKVLDWLFANVVYFALLTKILIALFLIFFIFLILSYIKNKKNVKVEENKKFFIKRFIGYPLFLILMLFIYGLLTHVN